MNDHSLPPIFAIDFPSIGQTGSKVDIDFGYVNSTKAAAGLVTAMVDKDNPTWAAQGASFMIGEGTDPVTTDGKTILTHDMIFGTYLTLAAVHQLHVSPIDGLEAEGLDLQIPEPGLPFTLIPV